MLTKGIKLSPLYRFSPLSTFWFVIPVHHQRMVCSISLAGAMICGLTGADTNIVIGGDAMRNLWVQAVYDLNQKKISIG
ncbi:MAG: hypothetical protein ABW080_10425 [Candidatus Thiodiazotropha sp.]